MSQLLTYDRKWWYLIDTCFVRGLIFGTFAISKAPLLSSKKVHLIVLLHSSMLITALIYLKICNIGVFSLNDVERAIHSAAIVESTISVCNVDFHKTGKPACLMTSSVLEKIDAGSSALFL